MKNINQVLIWIKERRKEIENPDGLPEDELPEVIEDEGGQAEIQLLSELESYIKSH